MMSALSIIEVLTGNDRGKGDKTITRSIALDTDSGRGMLQTSQPDSLPSSLYLHIPFCKTRCRYCDFATGLGTSALIEQYVQALIQEINFTPTAHQGLETVYFGGGTPSLLASEQVNRVMTALEKCFGIKDGAEVTMECNPGTVGFETLQGYRQAGVNRISLGVQAFQEELLVLCGRSHGVREVHEAVEAIKRADFQNFSVDLIFGLPHQTMEHWRISMQAALDLEPQHISAYDLIIEEGTPFERDYQPGTTPLPSEDQSVEMYCEMLQFLPRHGYALYEISNFAQPGYASRHNQVYWKNESYYGLGLGATGYVHYQRVTRPRKLVDYFNFVAQGTFPKEVPASIEDQLSETLMLGLRLVKGISLERLEETFGEETVARVLSQCEGFIQRGWIEITGDRRLCLTVPDGFLFSNEVLAALL
jgi:putative oxygen-independent coproporphyrinogen III oxidase